MNKRLKELAKEAGSVADATYAKAPDAIWLREYNKKFAELIVRECADLLETSLPYNPQQKMIKKHFGVEEK